jgi:hypothetical protein
MTGAPARAGIVIIVAAVLVAVAAWPGVSSPGAAAQGGEVLWQADMEDGSLAAWYAPDSGEGDYNGGGEYNSGAADAIASDEQAHGGAWSAKLAISTPPESGTRLFRWQELRRARDLVFDVWLFVPREYTLTADPATGRFWDLMQFKSIDEARSRNDPIWFLGVRNRRSDGAMVPELVWWSRTLPGPQPGQRGFRRFTRTDVVIPVGRWFRVTARVQQSRAYEGIVQFWLDGRLLFDQRGVRTGFSNCSYNAWCVDQSWSVNLYSDGLEPNPVMYVDDARISRPG